MDQNEIRIIIIIIKVVDGQTGCTSKKHNRLVEEGGNGERMEERMRRR